MVPQWQTPYLGARSLPKQLSGWEIDNFFTLSPPERDDIRQRFQGQHRLATALQLGFLRMSGCGLDGVRILPSALLEHIGAQLDITTPTLASVRALYRRARTRYDHQRWAMERLGFAALAPGQRRVLVTRLKQQVRTTGDVNALIDFARRWLYERRIIIPSTRTLKELVAGILVEVERAQHQEVTDIVPEPVYTRWLDELYREHPRYHLQLIDWLKTPPAKRSETNLTELFDKVAALKAFDVHRYDLPFPLERQRYYASRMRRRFPQRFKALSPARRTLELVCFLRVTLLDLTDTILSLSDKRVSELWSNARQTAERQRAENAHRAWAALQAVHHTLHDTDLGDRQARITACAIVDPLIERQLPPRAVLTREALTQEPKIRPLLRALMALDFQAAPDHPGWLALQTLRALYDASARELPTDIDVPVPPRWQPLVNDPDRKRALGAFEASTLYTLRRSLKNGSFSVDYSFAYRSRESMLIPLEEWEKNKGKYYKALGLARSPEKFLNKLKAQLKSGLSSLDAAVHAGELDIEEDTIHLPRITRESKPKGIRSVAKALFDTIGSVQFPNLLLEIDSHSRFSWQLLGRAPKSERNLLALYGALIAQGSELGAARVALMIPGVPMSDIQKAMQLLQEDGALAKANAAVLAFLRRHAIVTHWGDGTFASSDMIALEVSRHLWSARVDPKRRTHAVGSYVHVLDQWGISYDQPIIINEREAGPAIEGAIRSPGTKIEAVAVDTKGHTHFAAGFAKALGLDLYPRLRKLKYQKLFVPQGVDVPDTLKPILGPTVSLNAVSRDWDAYVRLVASVRYGWCSATMALRRYGSAARGEPLHGAGVALGKLVLTSYLCDYLSQPDFRREVLRILGHGESVHALQRAIHHGRPVAKRGRRREELVAQSGALALLTNITLAWNTHQMDKVHKTWRQQDPGKINAQMLRHITPVRYEHINFRGVFAFQTRPYRERLFTGSVTIRARAA